MYEFKMPKLSENISEATIITWFKNVGDIIEEDEMFLEVATDKVDSEVPSTVSGVVEELLYKSDDIIKIGEVIAIIKTNRKSEPLKNSGFATVLLHRIPPAAVSLPSKNATYAQSPALLGLYAPDRILIPYLSGSSPLFSKVEQYAPELSDLARKRKPKTVGPLPAEPASALV